MIAEPSEVTEASVNRSRIAIGLLVAILCAGAVWALVSTVEDAPPLQPAPGTEDQSLTEEERTYLLYMLPRLNLLIEEGAVVTALVDQRSRDVIALTRHGNRMTAVASDIIEWESHSEIPGHFLASHRALVTAASELRLLIGDAGGALLRFDFSGVADLIPQFENALAAIQDTRDELQPPDNVRL